MRTYSILIRIAVLLLVMPAGGLFAQAILMDQGVRSEGLWCFPLAANPREFVYLPARARLAENEAGLPQFSLLQYVVNTTSTDPGSSSVTAAAGGGVLTLHLYYDTPPEMIQAAERALRKTRRDDEIRVRGPIVFSSGTYALVSSIISDDGKSERKLVSTGRAPVLEGNRLALSFNLTPQQSSMLVQSLQSATPDVSLVFDLEFAGLADAYDAVLTIDWSEVRQSKSFRAGGNIYFVSVDAKAAIDELFRHNCIQLKTSGSDATSEALLNTVYNRLLDLLFRPVEPDRLPPGSSGGIMQAISSLLDGGNNLGFGIHAGFQLKDMRSEGRSVLTFNHRQTVSRHSYITFNVGNLHERWGKDPRFFRTANLADPAFLQREVQVAVDGSLLAEFDRLVNHVTVLLRKRHADGTETVRDVVITRNQATNSLPPLVYGWSGDQDRLAWLEYDYMSRWSFKGGGSYATPFARTADSVLNLIAPYERHVVQLAGDLAVLNQRGIKAAIIEVKHRFFTENKSTRLIYRPAEELSGKQLELTQPAGVYDYEYTLTWMLPDDQRLVKRGRDGSGIIFIDDFSGAVDPAAASNPTTPGLTGGH